MRLGPIDSADTCASLMEAFVNQLCRVCEERADEKGGDDGNDEQRKDRELSAALVIFHYYAP